MTIRSGRHRSGTERSRPGKGRGARLAAMVSAAGLAVGLPVGVLMQQHPTHSADEPVDRSPTRTLTSLPVTEREGATSRYPSAGHWVAVMERLGDRRASAWREGDAALLEGVFVAGSPALSRDRGMLAAYAARSLRVHGLGLDVDLVATVTTGSRTARLEVVDRLPPLVAVDAAREHHRLPRDMPSRHLIVLRRMSAGWRIAEIRDARAEISPGEAPRQADR